MRLLTSLVVVSFGAFLLFMILWYLRGFEKAKHQMSEVIAGNWGPNEIVADLLKSESEPELIRFVLPLKAGSHQVAGTSIRVRFQFLPGPDGGEPLQFRKLEVIHEGPRSDTSLFSSHDDPIVFSKSRRPSDDQPSNCRVETEWFVPRVTTSWPDQRADFMVMVLTIRTLNSLKSPCSALSADR